MSRKLKDSCDLCSASKVRCEKGKPACARCASMNELCLYSPARRAGRPRRLRRESYPEQGDGHGQGPQHHREAVTTPTVRGAQASDIMGDYDWAKPDQPEPPDSSAPLVAESDAISWARGDCAKTAALILEGLNAAKRGSHRPPQQPGCKITEACQQILTILVCPCSEQPAVALLVASGCLALMDTACRLARGHETAASVVSTISDNGNGTEQHQPPDTDWFRWMDLPTPPRPTTDPLHRPVGTDEVGVEGLGKIAKVILQFAARYAREQPHKGGTGGGKGRTSYTTQLVEPIVALLRSTLHSVTQEVTARLLL